MQNEQQKREREREREDHRNKAQSNRIGLLLHTKHYTLVFNKIEGNLFISPKNESKNMELHIRRAYINCFPGVCLIFSQFVGHNLVVIKYMKCTACGCFKSQAHATWIQFPHIRFHKQIQSHTYICAHATPFHCEYYITGKITTMVIYSNCELCHK